MIIFIIIIKRQQCHFINKTKKQQIRRHFRGPTSLYWWESQVFEAFQFSSLLLTFSLLCSSLLSSLPADWQPRLGVHWMLSWALSPFPTVWSEASPAQPTLCDDSFSDSFGVPRVTQTDQSRLYNLSESNVSFPALTIPNHKAHQKDGIRL